MGLRVTSRTESDHQMQYRLARLLVMYLPNAINSATQCKVMLPPSVQNIIHAEGVPRLRFDSDDVRESKVRFADNTL
jgi:hypothetical protein